jgi:hypothetical protein
VSARDLEKRLEERLTRSWDDRLEEVKDLEKKIEAR